MKVHARPGRALAMIVLGLVALGLALAASISFGAVKLSLSTVWDALFHYQVDDRQHQVIWELRLPRALAGALVGAAFSVSGALLQGLTRNPLADSGLLGINAGSGLVLAVCFAFFPTVPFLGLMGWSFVGAAMGALMIYGISRASKGGLTPVRMALAGAAISAMLIAVSEGIAIMFNVSQDLAFWYSGGIAGVKWMQVELLWPCIVIGIVLAIIMGRSLSLLGLGEETAAGLGLHIQVIKSMIIFIVILLSGASVAAAGSISFIGLIVPHTVRGLVGSDYRYIIPCSAVLGALLVVLADIGARLLNPPLETPIGALIALIGVPFFFVLARREGGSL
ncbi:FecCD family ABC transporter permease [Paenibacillus sp. 1001270B_150601_E10]|uniref:FecCD family ABC transporter permease n=1 Tax=Paenibacillus sp. 1001270B_150601_E10 TaxID=2787079 RepID=UPI001E48DECB|nr:iron ABC transporter permease [Paenibacillus sp. 1001270B_150601_E10]